VVFVAAILSSLIQPYKIVFMHRNIDEILVSQKKCSIHCDEDADGMAGAEMKRKFETHLTTV
jgi:hypothetical protein